jgi:hypothetical protein
LLQKLGKFKNEVKQGEIQAFVGPKMYVFKFARRIVKRAKGVNRSALKTNITFEHNVEYLINETVVMTSFNIIHSKKHIVTFLEQRKEALASWDHKWLICPFGIHTYAYGHFKIFNLMSFV